MTQASKASKLGLKYVQFESDAKVILMPTKWEFAAIIKDMQDFLFF
jgi:hypothetical protein